MYSIGYRTGSDIATEQALAVTIVRMQEQVKALVIAQEHLASKVAHIEYQQRLRLERLEHTVWSHDEIQGLTELVRHQKEQLEALQKQQTAIKARVWQVLLPVIIAVLSAWLVATVITPKPLLNEKEVQLFRERLYNLPSHYDEIPR